MRKNRPPRNRNASAKLRAKRKAARVRKKLKSSHGKRADHSTIR